MIRLEALGGLRVFQEGEELTRLPRQPRRAAVLVLVVVSKDVSRESLCYLLWTESGERRARRALAQTLHELKKDLGDRWVERIGDRLRVHADVTADVHDLAEAAEAGRHRDVVDLYRGPFLDGCTFGGGVELERWIDGKRSALHGRVRESFRQLTSAMDAPEERVRLARQWVDMDALDDEAHHALIEALASSGRRTDALDHYVFYKELIDTELEVEPLEHTIELVERIKRGELGPAAEERAGDRPPDVSYPEQPAAVSHDPAPGDATGPAAIGRQPPVGDRGTPLELAPGLVVLRPIGKGSTGVVYVAREPALQRLVAVKVLDRELADYVPSRARFEREALLSARVRHANVASVHAVGATPDGSPYFTMDFIKGVTLEDRLKAEGPLPADEVRRLLAEVASALACAHAEGVIHRDVRPANVLYEEGTGRPFLVDFGVAGALESASEEIARLTRTGELLGNVEYISPEQAAGDPCTDRSDVFSLGVMGWEMLLGRPSAGRSPPDLSPEEADLVDLLRRATAAKPRHRPSARQIAETLSREPGPGPRSPRWFREVVRRRVLPYVGAWAAVGWIGMGVVDQLVQQAVLPAVTYRLALAFFVAGLNASIVRSWFHGARGSQRTPATEIVLLAVVAVGWILASVLIVT